MSLAIEAIGLTKDFEKGRRTIWQRVALVLIGRWAWLATEHRLRVRGTLGQH
jgi:hypothetical protein